MNIDLLVKEVDSLFLLSSTCCVL